MSKHSLISWPDTFCTLTDDSYRLNLLSETDKILNSEIYYSNNPVTQQMIAGELKSFKLQFDEIIGDVIPYAWELLAYDNSGRICNEYYDVFKFEEEITFNLGWGAEIRSYNRESNPQGKIEMIDQIVFNSHRSGWKYAIDQIKHLHNASAEVIFDGFLENTFSWRLEANKKEKKVPYTRPWIGVLHNPYDMPSHFMSEHSPEKFMDSYEWLKSLVHCKGLFCLSEDHAERVRKETGKLVSVLKHPTSLDAPRWDFSKFSNDCRVTSIGWWLRNLNMFTQLEANGYNKTMLYPYPLSETAAYEKINDIMQSSYEPMGDLRDIERLYAISNEEYDELLTRSVVFLNLYASTANNAIIECIARGTPVLVNRLPSVEFYLGKDYPLYYDSIKEANELLADLDTIIVASNYLKRIERKNTVSGQSFLDSFIQSEVYQSL